MAGEFKQVLLLAGNILSKSNLSKPNYESKLIMSKLISKDLLEIFVNSDLTISEKQKKIFLKNIFKRFSGKPLSKIFGCKEFYSNEFYINNHTLDPRPESELLVDIVKNIESKKNNRNLNILDLGIGSGCLLISLVKELMVDREVKGIGVDICDEALMVSKKNIMKFGLENRIKLLNSNWFRRIKNKFDIIISNPPYIDKRSLSELDIEVKNYDPLIALNGGKEGLEAYKIISKESLNFLKKDGYICLEIGKGQKKAVEKLFEKNGFRKKNHFKDFLGIERVLIFKK